MDGEAGYVHQWLPIHPNLLLLYWWTIWNVFFQGKLGYQTTANHGILWSRSYFVCPVDETPVEIS
jgi:hypothetical protein